jgi:hypothetical protein
MRKVFLLPTLVIICLLALAASACGTSQQASGPNFKLLVSDDNNAIGDFDHLYINISSIGVHLANNSDNDSAMWTEFTPSATQVDLRLLTGDNASMIWSGNLTAGNYTKVFIYVNNALGILAGGNASNPVDVKIPSNKLQISKPFTVRNGTVTVFVYDITVISTGNDHSGIGYQIEPQIAKSGSNQSYVEVQP